MDLVGKVKKSFPGLETEEALDEHTVTTYHAEVLEGIPARMFYKKMGFAKGKLTEEFGSPVQEFVLKR